METYHCRPNAVSRSRGLLRLLGIFVLAHATALQADLIPAQRLTNWALGTAVGVPGGIPASRTTLVDVTKPPYNADATGATNAAVAIQAAINAAPPGSVVYLPEGKFRVDTTLTIGANKDGITLRGAGPAATILDSRAPTAIVVGTSSDYNWAWPTSGNTVSGTRTKGTTSLTIGNTDAFSPGQIVHIKVADQHSESAIQAGAVPVINTASWPENRKMKARVVTKTATSLTISPGLHFDCTGLTTTIQVAQAQTDSVGIEDFMIECKNGNVQTGVQLEQCFGSWIKNVQVNNAANYAFFLYDSLNCELRQSFANQRKTAGSNGAGILCNASSSCLIEDNIVYKFFPLIEVNQGSSGNVIGYNLFEDSRILNVLGSGMNTNHGPHNSYNLYEGNITPNIQSDGYFGSASEDTIFRNWIHGTVIDQTVAGFITSLNRFTRNYSLVGNILGASNTAFTNPYSFGNPNMGNSNASGSAQPSAGKFWSDWATLKAAPPGKGPGSAAFQELDLDVQATTLLKGNYIVKAGAILATEALGGETLPNSLYLPGKPAWFGSLAWPPFDPTAPNPQFDSIPAGQRFKSGSSTGGGGNPPSSTAPEITLQPQNQTCSVGDTVTFTVAASGTPSPTFQWRKDGEGISGATTATLTLANVQTSHAGVYTVVATNSAGSVTSNGATLTFASVTAPSFTLHPTNQTVAAGASATFTAEATGSPAPSYQWKRDGSDVAGSAAASFTIENVTSVHAGTYVAVASNSVGSATSNSAVLTVTIASSPPVFTQHPSNINLSVGQALTLSSAATGVPSPTYQWRKNGAAIAGATQSSYTIAGAALSDSGTYSVVATNSAGSATSNDALVVVVAIGAVNLGR